LANIRHCIDVIWLQILLTFVNLTLQKNKNATSTYSEVLSCLCVKWSTCRGLRQKNAS